MENNFKDFVNNNTCDINENLKQDAQSIINKYSNMSKNELTKALMQEVNKQKAQGTFDKVKLQNMLDLVKNMIPSESYNQVQKMLQEL
jgi:hypothetical protein